MTDQQTTSPLKAVVIGTGKISEEHLRFLDTSSLAQLQGVCDLSPAMARYAAQRFNAKDSFTDYRDMLEKVSPDVVHILTPPHTHVNLVTDCLNANAHVIIEKPVAPTNQQFLDLWQLAQDKNRHLIEDHNYRFNEPILAIEKLVADNTLGDITEVEIRMALPVTASGNRYADLNLPHPSHNMPAGVIHALQTIEVEQHQRQRLIVAVDARELLSEPLIEVAAIREACQRVGQRSPLQQIFVGADDDAESERGADAADLFAHQQIAQGNFFDACHAEMVSKN